MLTNKFITKINRFFYFGNRSFSNYIRFLEEAKKNNFRFISLKNFVNEREHDEKIIGLRHDVDNWLNHAIKIAEIEHNANIQATYFVLHTAKYFYKDVSESIINPKLITKLKYLQNTLGHEIGLHIDLMPIECIYKKEPDLYLRQLLEYLNKEGISIVGVAPHGNLLRHLYRKAYLIQNTDIKNSVYVNPYIEFDFNKFNLKYEAYNLDHDVYYSDARFIGQKRWDFSMIENTFFHTNNRTIFLTHPTHWAYSRIHYYTINLFINISYFLKYLYEFYLYKKLK